MGRDGMDRPEPRKAAPGKVVQPSVVAPYGCRVDSSLAFAVASSVGRNAMDRSEPRKVGSAKMNQQSGVDPYLPETVRY